jgi:hypothetical protein
VLDAQPSALAFSTLRAASGVGLGELVGKLGAFGLPAPVFLIAKIGGGREGYARGGDRCSGAWRAGARRLAYATHQFQRHRPTAMGKRWPKRKIRLRRSWSPITTETSM